MPPCPRKNCCVTNIATNPGCACTSAPATIYMTVSGSGVGFYNPVPHSDVLDWTTTGVNFGVGTEYYIGRSSFIDSAWGASKPYKNCINCLTNTLYYTLRRVYSDGTTDQVIYKWQIGLSGDPGAPGYPHANACFPVWQMLDGFGNPGYTSSGWPPLFNMTLHG